MIPTLTEGAHVRVVGTDDAAGLEGVVASVHVKNGVVTHAYVRFGNLVRRIKAADLEVLTPGGEQ